MKRLVLCLFCCIIVVLVCVSQSTAQVQTINSTVDNYVDRAAFLVAEAYASCPEDNFAISPLAISQIGGGLREIASGKTRKDLEQLLYLESYIPKPHFAEVIRDMEEEFGKPNFKLFSMFLAKETFRQEVTERMEETFGMETIATNFGANEIEKINMTVEEASGFKNVLKSDPRQQFVAVNASNIISTWPNNFGFVRRDNFSGEEVKFIGGKIDGYVSLAVNKQWYGYQFQMGNSQIFLVLAGDRQQLKSFASEMASGKRLEMVVKGKKKTPVQLIIPEVEEMNTEFDYRKFAMQKGLDTPFCNTANYSDGFKNGEEIFCSDLKTQSVFQITDRGISLRQVTLAVGQSKGMGMIGEKEDLPELVINRPFMILVCDKIGTTATMAFIADPANKNKKTSIPKPEPRPRGVKNLVNYTFSE